MLREYSLSRAIRQLFGDDLQMSYSEIMELCHIEEDVDDGPRAIKKNKLKNWHNWKQDDRKPRVGENYSSVKIPVPKPAASIQGPFNEPPPTFLHQRSLQNDSQSLFMSRVWANNTPCRWFLPILYNKMYHCSKPAASFQLFSSSLR